MVKADPEASHLAGSPVFPQGALARAGRAIVRRRGLLVSLGLIAILSHHAGDRFFYRPDTTTFVPEANHPGLTIEAVHFAAPGGPRLSAWWLPAQSSPRGTVVFCHGNGGNVSQHAHAVSWLPARGFQVLIFDYRGYGTSEGNPTREGTVQDAIAALDFALARDPSHTVLFGHSLGGAIGLAAAVERPAVRGVIVESSFPSYRAAARATAPAFAWLVPWLVSVGFEPEDAIARIAPRPVLVIHGSSDPITPLPLGEALFAAAREPKQWRAVYGGTHATPWLREGRAFEDAVCRFLDAALAR